MNFIQHKFVLVVVVVVLTFAFFLFMRKMCRQTMTSQQNLTLEHNKKKNMFECTPEANFGPYFPA